MNNFETISRKKFQNKIADVSLKDNDNKEAKNLSSINNFEQIKKIAESVKEAHSKNIPVCFTCDRVSSKKQEDNTSLRAQKERGLRYAQENDFIVAENYSFIESASKKVRKNFHAMMNDAIKFNIDIIIFKTVDRLARNLPDIQLILDFIYDHKRSVHLYDDGLRLTPEMDSNDALNFMLKGVLAKGETDRMGQRVRKAYEFKVQNGVKPGKAVFGYRYDIKKMKHEFDPETKPILEYIFSTFDNQNISCEKMAGLLNQRGYKTKKDCNWTKKTVYKALINPTYHGEFYSKGKLVKADLNRHDIYYPKKQYLDRMEKLSKNRSGLKSRNIQDPLARFILCPLCGYTMTPDIKTKKSGRQYHYYIHKCHAEESKKQITIPQGLMFSLIDKKIEELRYSEDFLSNLKYWVKGEIQEKNKKQDAAIKRINGQIDSMRRKKDRLLDLYAEDALDLNELKKKRESFEDEIEELTKNKNAILNIEDRRISNSICSTIDQIKELPILYLTAKNTFKKVNLLRNMVKEIQVANEQVNLIWKEPFSFLMKPQVLELNSILKNASIEEKKDGTNSQVRTSYVLRANQESIRTIIGEIKLNFRLWLMAS